MRRCYLPGLFAVMFAGCMTPSPFASSDTPPTPDEVITVNVSTYCSAPGSHYERVEWTFHPNGDCKRAHHIGRTARTGPSEPIVTEWNNPSDYGDIARLIRVWNLLAKEKPSYICGGRTFGASVKMGEREGRVSVDDGGFRPLKLRRLTSFLNSLEKEHGLTPSRLEDW